jgi:hypothetical protein
MAGEELSSRLQIGPKEPQNLAIRHVFHDGQANCTSFRVNQQSPAEHYLFQLGCGKLRHQANASTEVALRTATVL